MCTHLYGTWHCRWRAVYIDLLQWLFAGEHIFPSEWAAVALWQVTMYSEWGVLSSICMWCNSRNHTCQSFSEHWWSLLTSPKFWDRCVPSGCGITSACLHRSEMHSQLSEVTAGLCWCRYRCIESILEFDSERIAHRLEVWRQSICNGNCRGSDCSDSLVQYWHPCQWSEIMRWDWTILANAPHLEVWSFLSGDLVVDKATKHFHVQIETIWPHCVPSHSSYSENSCYKWRTLIDGQRCESCIHNWWSDHWMTQWS